MTSRGREKDRKERIRFYTGDSGEVSVNHSWKKDGLYCFVKNHRRSGEDGLDEIREKSLLLSVKSLMKLAGMNA